MLTASLSLDKPIKHNYNQAITSQSILTFTPNPSVDRTLHVASFVRGGVLRATDASVHPSGKGVNIVRALTAHGKPSRAVLPLGGHEGAQLEALAKEEGIELLVVPIASPVRANISVVEPDGVVTKLNEPGPRLTAGEWSALLDALASAIPECSYVVGCGSLPPGAPADLYGRLVPLARSSGARVAVDSSGPPLLHAAAAEVDLLKPNTDELAEAIGRYPATLGDALAGGEALRRAGARAVLVSLGPDGALLVDESGALHGEAPIEKTASTVGAGDALLAGFLSAGARGRHALAEGLAWAAAACQLPDSAVPKPSDLNRELVVIHDRVDMARPIASEQPAGGSR